MSNDFYVKSQEPGLPENDISINFALFVKTSTINLAVDYLQIHKENIDLLMKNMFKQE